MSPCVKVTMETEYGRVGSLSGKYGVGQGKRVSEIDGRIGGRHFCRHPSSL